MWNTIALVIAIILCLCVIAGVAYIINRSQLLDDREEDLKKYSADLDERANRLAKMHEELALQSAQQIRARYVITDSDIARYDNEAGIRKQARKRLAETMVFDIVKNCEPREYTNERGMRVLEYRALVK